MTIDLKTFNTSLLKGKTAVMLAAVLLMTVLLLISLNVLSKRTDVLKSTEEGLSQYNSLLSEYKEGGEERGALMAKVSQHSAGGLLQGNEEVMSSLGLKEKRSTIRSDAQRSFKEFREETAEFKLNAVSLNEIVNILYKIENGTTGFFVRKFSMKKGFSDPAKFDVTIDLSYVSMVSESKGQQRTQ